MNIFIWKKFWGIVSSIRNFSFDGKNFQEDFQSEITENIIIEKSTVSLHISNIYLGYPNLRLKDIHMHRLACGVLYKVFRNKWRNAVFKKQRRSIEGGGLFSTRLEWDFSVRSRVQFECAWLCAVLFSCSRSTGTWRYKLHLYPEPFITSGACEP